MTPFKISILQEVARIKMNNQIFFRTALDLYPETISDVRLDIFDSIYMSII
jgi:hypothetical protein